MAWLDSLLSRISNVFSSGQALPQRSAVNFTGPGVTVTDDPTNLRTNVNILGGGIAPSQGSTIALVGGLNSNISIPGSQTSWHFSQSSNSIVGGFSPASPPVAGQFYDTTFATGGTSVTIRNLDSASATSSQIVTPTGRDLLLPPGQNVRAKFLFNGTNFELKDSGVISVKEVDFGDYGPDATGTTDCSAALQAALNAAAALNLPCYAPGGTYLLDSAITIPLYTTLRGAGSRQTILKGNHAGDVLTTPGVVNGSTSGHILVEDLRVTSATRTIGSVTGATNASPIVLDVPGHGLSTGAFVDVASVGGNTNANGPWQVTVVDSNHFSLNGSTGNAAYTSGGTVTQVNRSGIYEFACSYDSHKNVQVDGCFFGRVWDQSELCSSRDANLTGNLIAQEYYVNGSDFNASAESGFTNDIVCINTTWNGGLYGLVDDGGVGHVWVGGNLNGQSTYSARIAGSENAIFSGIDIESVDYLFDQNSFLEGNATGPCISFTLQACTFGNGSHHSLNVATAGSIAIKSCALSSGLTQIVGGPNASRIDIDDQTSWSGTLIDAVSTNGYGKNVFLGSNAVQVTLAASTYTIDAANVLPDYQIILGGGPFAVNLPASTGSGRVLKFKATDSSAVSYTITPNGSDTIDGASSYVMSLKYAAIELLDYGSGKWFVTSSYNGTVI